MKDTNSDNDDRNERYTLQPVSIREVNYLLKADNDIGVEYHYLHDNWDREEYDNRGDVIDDLVEGIYWISDGNLGYIHKKLTGSEILRKWDGGIEDVNDRYEYWDKRKKTHYSRYPESSENGDDGDDEDGDNGSGGQVHRERAKSRSRAMMV